MQSAKSTESSKSDPKQATSRSGRGNRSQDSTEINANWLQLATRVTESRHAPELQAKVTVGATDDASEKEADRVASKVMRMTQRPASKEAEGGFVPAKRISASIQRLCDKCDEEKAAGNPVRRKQTTGGPVPSPTAALHKAIASPVGGSRVAESVRTRVEPVVGSDLSAVRVHSNAQTHEAALGINAKAFTFGNNVFLGAGQSSTDLGLMAHELTHTVQQSRSVQPCVQRLAGITPVNDCPSGVFIKKKKRGIINKKTIAYTVNGYPKSDKDKGTPGKDTDKKDIELTPPMKVYLGQSNKLKGRSEDYTAICLNNTLNSQIYWIKRSSWDYEADKIPEGAYDPVVGECKGETGGSCEAPISTPAPSSSMAGGLDISGPEWIPVYKPGIAMQEGPAGKGGANLRAGLNTSTKLLKWLPQNSHVYILKQNKKKKRYAVVALSGSGATYGYVADWLIAKNLPDPEAKIYKVKSGDTPLGIAFTCYGAADPTNPCFMGNTFNAKGKDKRYLVNALSWVNKKYPHNISGGPGISKKDDKSSHNAAVAYAGAFTWIPSPVHMEKIYEQVVEHGGGTGSITADLWRGVKKVGEYAAYGLAFAGGLIHGFVKSIYDAIAGVVSMVFDTLVSIFKGEVIQDAKALWSAISSMEWKDIKAAFGDWVDGWFSKVNNHDPWVSGHAHGYLTGYIMAEAAQLLLTAGTAAAAKSAIWGSRLGKIVKASKSYKALASGLNKARLASGKAKAAFAKAAAALRKTRPFKAVRVARQWLVDTIKLSAKTAKQITLYGANRLRELSDDVLNKLRNLGETLKRKLLGCHSPCDCDPNFIAKHIDNPSAAGKTVSPSVKPPKHYKTTKTSIDKLPRDSAGNIEPLKKGVVYEFDGGHRVWRDADGAIRHDSTIGDKLGRAHMEKEFFSATPHGNPKMAGMERAHTLGQGTGFESPFGLFYAPRAVNQILQNNGIEMFLRQLHKSLPTGRTAHVVTRTTPHDASLRLKDILYKVDVTGADGKRKTLFEYAVSVGNDAPNPTVTHGIVSVADKAKVGSLMDSISGADAFKKLLKDFIAD